MAGPMEGAVPGRAEAGRTIGAAARASGVSAKMIRHYEAIGLIPPPARTEAGYRVYTMDDIHRLRFIRRARDLGFSMDRIAALLALWQDRQRSSSDVKRLAERQIAELTEKIAALETMKATLVHLAAHCQGDDRPDCPILDDLAGPALDARPAAARRPRG